MISNLVMEGVLVVLVLLVGYLYYRHTELLKTLARPTAESAPLFDEAPIALLQIDADSRVQLANASLARLLDIDPAQLRARRFTEIIYPEDISAIEVGIEDLRANRGAEWVCDCRVLHSGGYVLWTRLSIRAVRDARQHVDYLLAALIDIGDKQRAQQIARIEEQKLTNIVDQVPVIVWMQSPAEHLLFINNAYETISGRSKESVYGNPASYLELVHPEDLPRLLRFRSQDNRDKQYELNYRLLRDDGEIRYVREMCKGIHDEQGSLLHYIASVMDISSEMVVRDELHELNSRLREANLRLQETAKKDNLTRCLNRAALLDEAEKALQLEQRYGRSSTLVFFDMNNFKEVNDNFGHHVGDRALIAFAEQIKSRLRTTDELGRYGGDEFIALLRETDSDQARQLLATLPPVVLDNEDGSSIILRYSAGVASSNEAGIKTIDDWLRIADTHMYQHKLNFQAVRTS